jgi:hypothetical protein
MEEYCDGCLQTEKVQHADDDVRKGVKGGPGAAHVVRESAARPDSVILGSKASGG